MTTSSLTYDQAGVDYDKIDPLKVAAQRAAASTATQLAAHGFEEVKASRGESAYVVDVGPFYLASIVECLGSKALVADEMARLTGRSYYASIAQDTIAMAVNDLITVGATPLVVQAYWAAGGSEWFGDAQRAQALVEGWKRACETCGVAWGGGETPALAGIVEAGRIDLAASCTGLINPKQRLSVGDKLGDGDAIVLLASSGIHANGVSLARKLVERLPQGWLTPIDAVLTGHRSAVEGRHRAALLRQHHRPRLAQAAAASGPLHLPHHAGAAGAAHSRVHCQACGPRCAGGLLHLQHGRRLRTLRRGRAGRAHGRGGACAGHRGLGGRPHRSRRQATRDRAAGPALRRRCAATALKPGGHYNHTRRASPHGSAPNRVRWGTKQPLALQPVPGSGSSP
jgi:hypothetical protein